MKSSPIVICTKSLNNIKYNSVINWTLLEDFNVVYESRCPEKNIYHKQEMCFDNLPIQIKIMIAKQAIKSPFLKTLESKEQLKLVLFAVKESTINSWL
ncbi:hypothetical protein Riv7116_2114 [Rivularia sp. PCC 7116]|uniref:hypothetical protein n=1 Tax=Rivularia sp. PCC 7116 TaxID=373994 RepID=UPI00029F3EAD|nr:hypothetical protein [Rivularia sp. PCC 7116]AFY54645.1 hypothetical protein Riv7116_2114 [Rivularia sp. PCC 7116]